MIAPQTASKNIAPHVLVSTNPATRGDVLGDVYVCTLQDVQHAVSKARKAFPAWAQKSVDERCKILAKMMEAIKTHQEEIVRLTSQEMGMPTSLSQGVFQSAFNNAEWMFAQAPDVLKETILFEDQNNICMQTYEPFGVVAAVVAWNFPLGNFAMSILPALIAGNTVVMKYSEEVPLFAKLLEKLINESNTLPDGVMNFVFGAGDVGQCLCDQGVDFITFTGSSATGKKIYAQAAEKLIPVALELGGSSPGIVMGDCTLTDALVDSIFWRRFNNSGQFCDGLKRLIVHRTLHDELVKKLVERAQKVQVGDPLAKQTQLGPLVNERQVKKLIDQIQDAKNKGASVVCGGKKPAHLQGSFYEPTILTNVTQEMRVWKEEVFGPCLAVITFDTLDEAIALANDTPYGLSGYVYCKDPQIKQELLRALHAGSVSDITESYGPYQPFGGYKQSGIGRQLGVAGLHHHCQIKVISAIK